MVLTLCSLVKAPNMALVGQTERPQWQPQLFLLPKACLLFGKYWHTIFGGLLLCKNRSWSWDCAPARFFEGWEEVKRRHPPTPGHASGEKPIKTLRSQEAPQGVEVFAPCGASVGEGGKVLVPAAAIVLSGGRRRCVGWKAGENLRKPQKNQRKPENLRKTLRKSKKSPRIAQRKAKRFEKEATRVCLGLSLLCFQAVWDSYEVQRPPRTPPKLTRKE